MTSLFQVLAHDDSETRKIAHKAAVLAKTRVDNDYGKFIASHGPSALEYLESEIKATIHIACAEVGHVDADSIVETVLASYQPEPATKTASTVHEARMPKMCPFHKEVVNISRQTGDPRAGYDAMGQHWGGPRHCEGDGYEGDKCKFKPQMTTESYWEERAEKLEQKRQERAERAEQEQAEVEPEVTEEETPEVVQEEQPEVETEGTSEQDGGSESVADDNVIHVDFGGAEVEAPADGTEVPMSMAASTKTADGGPVPTMDKRKWTPQNVRELDVDDEDGPHPTRRKDIVDPVRPNNEGDLKEIGEQVTERQDVTQKADNIVGEGGTFGGGGRSAVSSHDPQKNELVEIMKNDFDGFLPEAEVQQAVLAHRNR